jgi:hypothetical protein
MSVESPIVLSGNIFLLSNIEVIGQLFFDVVSHKFMVNLKSGFTFHVEDNNINRLSTTRHTLIREVFADKNDHNKLQRACVDAWIKEAKEQKRNAS